MGSSIIAPSLAQVKSYDVTTDATEHTTTATSLTLASTATFNIGAPVIILGILTSYETKNSNASYESYVKTTVNVVGSTQVCTLGPVGYPNVNARCLLDNSTEYVQGGAAYATRTFFWHPSSSNPLSTAAALNGSLGIMGTDIEIKTYIATNNAAGTTYIDTINHKVYYMPA